ncbi:hypothetical protein [Novosphingobium sp. BL-52-GroH]|uniref:hypothetical protein n=1 Tax=Novosphingobium sp. BL-52-GroH TaxID=3349877 RepID=UPI00384F5A49
MAAYDIRKNNVQAIVDIGDGNTITEARDEVTSRGVECDLVSEVTRRLSTIASYAYIDARDPQSTSGGAVTGTDPDRDSGDALVNTADGDRRRNIRQVAGRRRLSDRIHG